MVGLGGMLGVWLVGLVGVYGHKVVLWDWRRFLACFYIRHGMALNVTPVILLVESEA